MGVVFTISTLPVIDLLPEIPLFSSIVPLIGLVTLAGYLFQSKRFQVKKNLKVDPVLVFGILYVIWIVISNPSAAIFGRERNWLFTCVQLLVLMFLASKLLDTSERQKTAILIFALASMTSAIFAISQGNIAEDALSSERVAGLATNANQAARYFVVALVFFYYLRSKIVAPFPRFLFLIGIIITFLGVFFTVSRSGMLLLFGTFGLILIFQPRVKNRAGLVALLLVGIILLSLFSDSIFQIIRDIFPAIRAGTDTVGLRYSLWRAGWRMWLDHPITGVGIGQYNSVLWRYMQDMAGPIRGNASSHNTYVQVLSETGFVGLILFLAMLISAFMHLWPSKLHPLNVDVEYRNMWFIILIVISIGGITITDLVSKLLWVVLGVSIVYAKSNVVTEEIPAPEKAIPPRLSSTRLAKNRTWQK